MHACILHVLSVRLTRGMTSNPQPKQKPRLMSINDKSLYKKELEEKEKQWSLKKLQKLDKGSFVSPSVLFMKKKRSG